MARLGTGAAFLTLASGALAFAVMGEQARALRFLLGIVLLLAVTRLVVPGPYEAAFSVTVALSLWCDTGQWYRTVPHLDTAVHFLLSGTGCVIVFFALLRLGGPAVRAGAVSAPRWVLTLWVAWIGLATAAVWELYEWVVEELAPRSMRVGYDDTIADLAAGLAGCLLAGAVLAYATHGRLPRDE
ncbi:hypothetical protein [Streptomyces peucetius]|uniref:DUF2238 domain-containing protein n=1 Tax=Streptomyces peucetius TaxID=1950 RepID=A0ABY6HZP4_STRPE|nr:hypothetical protein [Streptomyces peucetius]UYQ60178.1 hypothetical protein OGH68_00930 [Streptomyces peucetius]